MSFLKRIYKSFVGGPFYLVLFGLVFFGIGAGLTYRQQILENQSSQAIGEVIYLSESCDDDGCTYAPVVRFETKAGNTVSFESLYSSSPPAYHVGESVQVIYSPENPEKAVIKGEGMLFRIIFMIVGGIVVTVGLGIFGMNVSNSYLESEKSES